MQTAKSDPEIFTLYLPQPNQAVAPLIISSPHTGTFVPADIAAQMNPEILASLPDTDWQVDALYRFAIQSFGASQIAANYSRYVIDLNRSPEDEPLYNDGRLQSGLVPMVTSQGEAIYRSSDLAQAAQTPDEKERRRQRYYAPYHAALGREIARLRALFPHVLLVEAHSIQPFLPRISPRPFADIILGDQHRKTAHPSISEACLAEMRKSGLQIADNEPFRGGHITRFYGKPENGVHAIQLEMSQKIYWQGQQIDPLLSAPPNNCLRNVLAAALTELGKIP